MASVGTAYIEILPSLKGFQTSAAAQLRDMQLDKSVQLTPTLDTAAAAVAADRAGAAAGAAYGGRFAETVRASIDAALRSLPAVQVDADSSPAQAKLAELRAQLVALSQQRLGVDITDEQALATLNELRGQLASLRNTEDISVRVNAAAAEAELATVRAEVNDAAGQTARVRADADDVNTRSQTLFGSLQARTALITAGIAAAAPLAGAAILGGIGAGFIATAAVAQRSNEEVQQSYVQLGHDVVTELRNASDQVVPALAASGRALDAQMQALGPAIGQAMAYAGPDIATLTRGVTSLASGAMPGLVAAMQASQPVAAGMASAMSVAGTATGAALQSLSSHSQEFGVNVASLGPIVSSVLGLATTLVEVAGAAWAQNATAIDSAIGGVASALSGLASGILPVLSTALGAAAGAIQDITAVLGPVAPLLGTVAAGAAATWAAFKLADLATAGVKALADGVVSLGGVMQTGAARTATMIAAMQGVEVEASATATGMIAAGRGAAEASIGFSAAAEAIAGPLGLALVAGTLLFGLFASSEDKAKQSGADLTQTSQQLTDAFRASHGAINDGVLSALQATTGYKQASDAAAQFGLSQSQITQAVVAGGASLDDLRGKLQAVIAAHTQYAGNLASVSRAQQEMGVTTSGVTRSLDAQGQQAQSALDSINNLVSSFHNGQISGTQLDQALQAVGNTLVSGQEYQDAAAASARTFGLSLGDVTAGYQSVITSGNATTISVSAVSEAFIKSSLAVAQAGQAITSHFQQADASVASAQQSVTDANHSYQSSIQSVADAQHSYAQAAQAVVQAEQGVADAQHGVAQAQQAVAQAYAGVTSAEQAYARAQDQERTAQLGLNAAREQAIEDLKALHLQLADQVASEESARVQLFDAQQAAAALGVDGSNAQAIASQDVSAANEDQVKAAIGLLQAQNALNNAMNSGANLRKQVSAADAAGVEGSQVVINAQQSLRSAQDQVTSSAQALVRAHQQVTDAEYSLQQAGRNLVAAQQAVSEAAYNEQRAHQAVTDAQYQQQHAADALRQAQDNLRLAQDAASRSLDGTTQAGQGNLGLMLQLWDAIQKTGIPVQDQYRQMIDNVASSFGLSRDNAENYLKQLGLIPQDFKYSVTAVANVDQSSYDQLLNTILGTGPQPNQINSLGGLLGLPGHAQGGAITGPGGPRDDNIPVMVSAGEYIIPADAVSYYGLGAMEALRTRTLPKGGDGSWAGYADGGLVQGAIQLGLAGANYLANVNAAQVMGLPHPPSLPVYVPPPPPQVPTWTAGAGVAQWSSVVLQVLSMLGQPASLLSHVLRRMNQESGGNPNAVNRWDSNWLRGTPSVGLMQVIGPTFRSNAGPFAGRGPFEYGVSTDPLANIYAGLHYAIARYPSLQYAMDKPGGYDSGGWLPPGLSTVYNGTSRPEAILTGPQWDAIMAGQSGGQFTGALYLDSGEFLGVVSGVVESAGQATGTAIATRSRL